MKFSAKHSIQWSIFISAVTFLLACVFSVVSTIVLEGVSWGVGVLIVIALVLVGIIFDMMGISSAAASETPFHAMASERVRGAKQAIFIVRNADRFSSFCNDVIGDISGIISGAATAIVVMKLMMHMEEGDGMLRTIVSVVFTGVVSALTVGGKAMGKSVAIHFSTPIVLWIGRFFYLLERRLNITVFTGKKTKSGNGKRGK